MAEDEEYEVAGLRGDDAVRFMREVDQHHKRATNNMDQILHTIMHYDEINPLASVAEQWGMRTSVLMDTIREHEDEGAQLLGLAEMFAAFLTRAGVAPYVKSCREIYALQDALENPNELQIPDSPDGLMGSINAGQDLDDDADREMLRKMAEDGTITDPRIIAAINNPHVRVTAHTVNPETFKSMGGKLPDGAKMTAALAAKLEEMMDAATGRCEGCGRDGGMLQRVGPNDEMFCFDCGMKNPELTEKKLTEGAIRGVKQGMQKARQIKEERDSIDDVVKGILRKHGLNIEEQPKKRGPGMMDRLFRSDEDNK